MSRSRVVVVSSFVLMFMLNTLVFVPDTLGVDPPPSRLVRFEEVVTNPKQDRNDNDRITSIDEMIVLVNMAGHAVDLAGWRLYMEDTTPEEQFLVGELEPGERHVIVNPRGSINNDVHLWLFDADGDLVDRVHLGTDVPNGRSTSLLDEAVHLLGPWAGMKGPATNGIGLGPFWVERIVPTTLIEAPPPLEATWLPAGPAALEVRVHQAPGHAGSPMLVVAGDGFPLTPQADGSFFADGIVLHGEEASLAVRVGDATVATWPDGRPLRFPIDRSPPRIEPPHEAVMNATRHLHWLPPITDDESGLAGVTATATHPGEVWTLPSCMLPFDAPTTCPLPDNVTGIDLHVWDVAGNAVTVSLQPIASTHAPMMPQTFTFEIGVPPTVYWPAFSEILTSLKIETADDTSGTWNRTAVALQTTATVFTDHDWVPGATRAYRLVATDRGGQTASSPWVALPEEAVPVTYGLQGLDAVAGRLLEDQGATVQGTFDRPLKHAPVLVLDIDRPRPYRMVLNGSLSPDARVVSWSATPDGFPRSGEGHWSFGGGAGNDGAPLVPLRVPVTWDLEPPRIDLVGVVDGWVRADRHVVMVSARDIGPVPPRITVHAEGAVISEYPGRVDVLVQGEGAHLVHVMAEDPAGNRAEEHFTLRLDATPPEVRLVSVPETWSSEAPILLAVLDEGSGIDPASFSVEVRSPTGVFAPNVTWNGTHARLVPAGQVEGPFELHVGVADQAGNQVMGLLGVRLTAPGLPVQVVLNGTTAQGNTTSGGGPLPGPTHAGGLAGPTVAEPGTSWRDLTLPMTKKASGDEGDAATTAWSWVAGVVGAGVVGLGTMVRRRQKTRIPTKKVDGNDAGTAEGVTDADPVARPETPATEKIEGAGTETAPWNETAIDLATGNEPIIDPATWNETAIDPPTSHTAGDPVAAAAPEAKTEAERARGAVPPGADPDESTAAFPTLASRFDEDGSTTDEVPQETASSGPAPASADPAEAVRPRADQSPP